MILHSEAAFNPTDFIRTNGTTVTTALIPFAEGITIPPSEYATFGSAAIGYLIAGYGSTPVISTLTNSSLVSQQLEISTSEDLSGTNASGAINIKTGQGSNSAGAINIQPGAFVGAGAAAGAMATITGGAGNGTGAGGSVVLAGGDPGAGAIGPVAIANKSTFTAATPSHTLTRYSLYVTNHIELDGQLFSDIATGTAPFTVASTTKVTNLNVDQVDGAHVGTSGAAIPLLNGANTWSGANVWTSSSQFQNTTVIQDNQIFQVGDNSGSGGYMAMYQDTLNGYGVVDLSQIEALSNSWLSVQGGSIQINVLGTIFSAIPTVQVGSSVTNSVPSINHLTYIGVENTTTSTARTPLVAALGVAIGANSSGQHNACNQISVFRTTTNLTSATIPGISGGRNRVIIATSASGTITLAAATSGGFSGATTNTPITDYANFYSEQSSGSGAVFTRHAGFFFKDIAAFGGGGSATNLYGYRAEKPTRGTNNYAFASEGTGAGSGIYFNVPTSSTAATEYVRASAASTLQLAANTTQIFDIGGTTQLTLASNSLTLKDALNVVLNTTTGTKWATATTQKQGWWNATPVVQDTGWSVSNVTTDRVYDANSTTLDEIADVLGTLINQLKTYGLLGA